VRVGSEHAAGAYLCFTFEDNARIKECIRADFHIHAEVYGIGEEHRNAQLLAFLPEAGLHQPLGLCKLHAAVDAHCLINAVEGECHYTLALRLA
jgi:hypothetical protein